MSKEKKENCELNSHLYEAKKEETVELPVGHERPDSIATSKPDDTDEVKLLIKANKCGTINGTSTNNNDSGLGDSVRYLDSVLEYTSKIRVFVGLDDDSEPPPLPTSNPLDFMATKNALGKAHSNDSDDGDDGLDPLQKDDSDLLQRAFLVNTENPITDTINETFLTNGLKNLDVIHIDNITDPDLIAQSNALTTNKNNNSEGEDLADKKNIPIAAIVPVEYPAAESQQIMDTVTDDTIVLFQNIVPDFGNLTPNDIQLNDDIKNIPRPDDKGFTVPYPMVSTNSDDDLADITTKRHLSNSEKTENKYADNIKCESSSVDKNFPELFSFEPDFVKDLRSEDAFQDDGFQEDEVKPVPNLEVLRRLSTEIVKKVLDDAGGQIQEILNERRKSSLKQNEPISNIDELVNVSLTDENNICDTQKNTDVLDVEDSSVTSNNDLSNNIKENYTVFKKSLDEPNSKTEIKLKDVLAKTYDCNDFQKKFEQEMIKFDPKYDVDPDTICGIGHFKPKWLQRWATARVYLIFYSIVGTLSGSYYTYLIGTITTLEKRYAFDSKITGTIMMVDELTPLFLGSIVGYFGGKAHRPRMIGLGMLLSSICCFISAAPYFIYGPEKHINVLNLNNGTSLELCNGELRDQNCGSDDRPPTLTAILLLMLGSFLKGFGNLAYYAIGMSYMDDVSKKKNAPIYFAVTFAIRLVGPVIGFLLSSAFLKYPEYPFDNPEYGPEDPRWIGAWWIGFVLQGILLLIFSIPIALFPRRLPGTTVPTTSTVNAKGERQDIVHNIAGLFSALKRLATNPIFIFYTLDCVCSAFGVFGHYVMLPKYMEHQFQLSASDASLLSGPPALCAIILAMLIGGYCIWKFKPNAKVITALMAAVQVVGFIGYSLLMIPKCEKVQMMNFGINDKGFILEDMCNTNCNCTTAAFTPVCGPDGKTTYFSPCYAGCSETTNKTYFNCSCLADFTTHQGSYVTQGFCTDENCWNQALIYIIFLICLEILINLLRVAFTIVLLRSVLPEDKSIALGTFETLICAFTFIPFPLVFGAMIDSCCLVWEKSCDKTGNCWFYDTDKFNHYIHGTSAAGCLIGAICMTVIFILSDRLQDLYKEDNEESTNDKEIEKNIKPPTGQIKQIDMESKM